VIVLDASVLANALADDGASADHARAAMRGQRAPAAPELIDAEAMHVFRKLWLAGGLSVARFRQATSDRRLATAPGIGCAVRVLAQPI
jgi:predicted nucleic acid-binding protein